MNDDPGDFHGTLPTEAEPRALPAMFYNVDKLPALFAALAAAQGEYLPVVRNRKVVQKLRDKDTRALTGAQITFWYAELATILDATRAALSKNGLTFIQPVEWVGGEPAFVNNIIAHKDGGMIITKFQIAEAASQAQFGGNITYARRFSAGPSLGVSAEDDADTGLGEDDDDEGGAFPPQASQRRVVQETDSAPTREQPQRLAETSVISPGQLKNLKTKIDAAGLTPEVVMAACTRLGLKNGVTEKMTIGEWKLLRADIDKVV